MTTRRYSSRSQQTTLTSAVTATGTSITVVSGSALLGGATVAAGETFTIVIDPDTALEEIVDVYSASGSPVSTNTLTIVRAVDTSPATGQAHSAGAVVRHMAIGRDYREANAHIETTRAAAGTAHGIPLDTVVLTSDTGTVSTGMLAANAVTTAKITDLNVTTGKIADSAVTSAKIADLTIATGDIADSAITSAKIADLTIVNGDIAALAAIDKTKISGTAITAADTGTVTSTMIADGTIVNADVNSSAQIAYSKLTLTNTVTNADINASAAIAMSKLAVDPTARANHTGTQLANTISNLDATIKSYKVTDLTAPTTSVSVNSQKIIDLATPTLATDAATKAYADTMIPLTQKGAANGVAELDATGKIPFDHIPASVIANTFVVSSQAAMLALAAGVGDIAVRTDLNKSFILQSTPATTLGNWIELLTPLDAVTSVDGQVGIVSLSSTYATIANAANKLPLAGGTMSGPIAMGTNKITGLGDPTTAQDAATKNYIDTVVLAPSNLTGVITSVGNVTSIASQTGTGSKFVVDTSPTLVTPELGAATATSINGTVIPASKTLVATDSTTYVVPPQTSNSGKFLTTNGTVSSWSAVNAATPTVAGVVFGSTSINNTSIGSSALNSNTSGLANTAVGFNALNANTDGRRNIAIGDNSLVTNTTGEENNSIGRSALAGNTTGVGNVVLGNQSLQYKGVGDYNSAIGLYSGINLSSGSNNTFIGYNSQPTSSTTSNEVVIGNSSVTNFKVPGIAVQINKSTAYFDAAITEKATVSATAATGTINYEVITNKSITYYTTAATGNWTFNVRGDGTTTLNSILDTGKSLTVVFMNTNTGTAYYPTGFQVDGTTVTPKWQGGTAPTSGNVNSVDIYTYTIIKTASATYSVFASQTKFA